MRTPDEYLLALADRISSLADTRAWQGEVAATWNPAGLVQSAPEVEIDVDLVEFDQACLESKASSVARLMWTPGVPELLRCRVAEHPDHQVRGWVVACTTNVDLYDKMRRDLDPRVRAYAVLSRFTSVQLLREFSKDRRAEVRAAVAADSRAPQELLLVLTGDRSSLVRWQLGVGPHMYNREILQVLRDDPDETLAGQALGVLWSLDHPDEIVL